jgi:hypothetical protein
MLGHACAAHACARACDGARVPGCCSCCRFKCEEPHEHAPSCSRSWLSNSTSSTQVGCMHCAFDGLCTQLTEAIDQHAATRDAAARTQPPPSTIVQGVCSCCQGPEEHNSSSAQNHYNSSRCPPGRAFLRATSAAGCMGQLRKQRFRFVGVQAQFLIEAHPAS